MLILNLAPGRNCPLYQQIVEQIKALIVENTLKTGDILPPSRLLAAHNKVSRHTVCKAYDELVAKGFAISSPGGHTRVRRVPHGHFSSFSATDNSETELSCKHSNQAIDFCRLDPDPTILPVRYLRKSINRVLKEQGARAFGYCDTQGILALRTEIANLMCLHGIRTHSDLVFVTQGATGAIELVFKTLLKAGDAVIIERPTYSGVITLLKRFKVKIIEVEMTEEGMDLQSLAQVLMKERVAFVYTMPNFQNPTGITTKIAHRESLIELCNQHQVKIVEDGFEEELKYIDPAIPPLKALDVHDLVFYVGTFSKVIAPGLRTGWLIPPENFTDELLEVKQSYEHSGNSLSQLTLADYCSTGEYHRQMKRLHRVYRRRMETALASIKEFFPDNFKTTRPKGGYVIWCECAQSELSEVSILSRLEEVGVVVFPGSSAYLTKRSAFCFRISIATVDEKNIRLGIKKIGDVLRAIPAAPICEDEIKILNNKG